MSTSAPAPKRVAAKAIGWLLENSAFLLIGTLIGLVWVNSGDEARRSYEALVHLPLMQTTHIGEVHHGDDAHGADDHGADDHGGDAQHGHGGGHDGDRDEDGEGAHSVDNEHVGYKTITLHFVVNDMLMALFFAIAGKEVWEATLPGGPLSNPRRAAVPLLAAIGGMLGPALLYLAGAQLFGQFAELNRGWAIPCATDIAFSYMIARIVFGAGHPAIPFLLLLAIADDAMGLVILAVAYPQGEIALTWMLLPVAAMVVGLMMQRLLRLRNFWPYLLICGTLSWYGFARAGLHPALGLLPIIPTMPHAHVDKGLFNWQELDLHDTLNEFEHWWKSPVELILGLFGLLNAGVLLGAISLPTYLIVFGLLVGKPLGIWSFGMLGGVVLRLGLPTGINGRVLFVIGCAGSIGFTVALFIAGVAFPNGSNVQDAAKMGALLSFGGAILTLVAAPLVGVKRWQPPAVEAAAADRVPDSPAP